MTSSIGSTERRALLGLGAGLAAVAFAPSAEAATASLEPAAAKNLAALSKKLAAAPRRRDFKTVPMILRKRDEWDAAALDAVLAYRGGPRQAYDNTDINGPWLNLMRNSMNAQIWSFGHPDFLCVSATHGTAQLAIYDQAMWDKYGLAKMAGGKPTANTLLELPAAAAKIADFEAPDGAFSPQDNSITALQARGAVFLACHNAIWEQATHLVQVGANPDHASVDVVAAELTNHLAPGVVLTPGAVGTIVELGRNGFVYTV
jgi:hypothetical protein